MIVKRLIGLWVNLSVVVIAGIAYADNDMVSVVCSELKPKHVLLKNSERGSWCDLVLPGYCHENQRKAAEITCGKRFAADLNERQIDYLSSRNELLSKKGLDLSGSALNDNAKPIQVAESESQSGGRESIRESALTVSNSSRHALEIELLDINEALLNLRKRRIQLERETIALQAQLNSYRYSDSLTAN